MRLQRGFTLMEVLIAMIIITGAILVLANSWSGSLMQIRKASLNNNVAVLLERKMIEVEVKYRNKFSEIPESESGDFGSDNPLYTWELKMHELKVPDLTALLMKETGGADEMLISMIKQLTEYLNKTVKEVRVTILVKTPRKVMAYSATTYFIDYTQDIGIGGGAAPAAGAGSGTGGSGAGGTN